MKRSSERSQNLESFVTLELEIALQTTHRYEVVRLAMHLKCRTSAKSDSSTWIHYVTQFPEMGTRRSVDGAIGMPSASPLNPVSEACVKLSYW